MIIDRNAVTQEVPIDPETGKPYLNTVAAIQVSANGVGSEVSPYVAQAVEVIRESGLPQETNALFTNVEGDLDTSKGMLCYYTFHGAVAHPWGGKTLMGR